jgi:hypothetical protein
MPTAYWHNKNNRKSMERQKVQYYKTTDLTGKSKENAPDLYSGGALLDSRSGKDHVD